MSEPTQIEMMNEAELRREIGELIAQNISANAQLSTLEGIIQKQKEALEISIPYLRSASNKMYDGTDGHTKRRTALVNLDKAERALALSPSTFASRPDKEKNRIEALEKALSLALQYVPLTGKDAEEIYRLEKESYISQQPEGAGKE